MALDALMWARAAGRCKALAAGTDIAGHALTPINVALFNVKQLYLWTLLAFSLGYVPGASNVPRELLVYLMSFAMVLHSFNHQCPGTTTTQRFH